MVVLGANASELYHSSLLGHPITPLPIKDNLFAVEKAGKKSAAIHDHLIKLGFQKKTEKTESPFSPVPVYHRGDLGTIRFVFPQKRPGQPVASTGLAATPEKGLEILLENPHSVEVKYLDQVYDVYIPQIGRFVLANGLKVKISKKNAPLDIYRAAMHFIYLLDLLVENEEFEEEALNDFLEIRPRALLREFRDNLKANGPGSILWESAQKLYLNLYPNVKAVKLISWHWKFQKRISKTILDSKTAD
jgi:hypothetical protein